MEVLTMVDSVIRWTLVVLLVGAGLLIALTYLT